MQLTNIEQYCFHNSGLTEITIPNSVTQIGIHAFSECFNLKTIIIPEGLKVIPKYCFWKSRLEEIEIPESVKMIESSAFSECANLKRVDLPDNLEIIS